MQADMKPLTIRILLFLCVYCYQCFLLAGQWTIQLENDVTFYEDGNYTNGLMFNWQSNYSPLKKLYNDLPVISQWQSKLLIQQEVGLTNWGLKLSQRMWTPDEIKIELPQPLDRPYAGVLEFELHSAQYSNILAQKNWITVGIIGPSSGAEKLQSLFHSSTSSSAPKGWKYQIENEGIFSYSYELDKLLIRRQKFSNYQWELSGHGYGSLSNLRSELATGLTFRWGTNLADSFGRLSNHYGQISNLTSLTKHYDFTFFTRAQIGYRLNDKTITGDLPYQSQIEVQHEQAHLKLGVNLTFPHFSVLWSINAYTRDYQSDKDSWHGYGSLSLSWSI